MSKEGSPELTKSWIFVDSEKQTNDETSGVLEVFENEPHIDSDTDSISVISESGCSYKTDEEEFASPEGPTEKEVDNNEQPKIPERQQEIVETVEEKPEICSLYDKVIENLRYFATSAACAIILVGFSVAVQHYFQDYSNVNIFNPDQVVFPHVQNLKRESVKESQLSKFNLKRKSQLKLDELENKIAKLQEDNEFHDKIPSPIGDNDLKLNNKLNKNNAAARSNKENYDVSETRRKMHGLETDTNDKNEDKHTPDETYAKREKELKIKEDYLREKEKFLIEKEHDLLKKEIKLGKEKHDKKTHKKECPEDLSDEASTKTYHKKEKEYKEDSSEETSSEKGEYKVKKEHVKKHKQKDEKKQHSTQKRHRFSNEENKKRNISGQWYINLHEGRDSMRQKKRASFKKNKANWYFQWMVDRARLRVK